MINLLTERIIRKNEGIEDNFIRFGCLLKGTPSDPKWRYWRQKSKGISKLAVMLKKADTIKPNKILNI